MRLRYPEYYEAFHCIAGACEDSCCAGWEIDIDEESYEYYQQVSGTFGKRLRENIKEYTGEEDERYERHGFALKKERRCPFLNERNLCDIILELGEGALCYVCTHTPRNYFEYNDTREITVSPSCPEAGRLIFFRKAPVQVVEQEVSEKFPWEETEEERFFAGVIQKARDAGIFLLQQRMYEGQEIFVEKRLCRFLFFAKELQELLNSGEKGKALSFAEDVLSGDREITVSEELFSEKEFDAYDAFCKRLRIFSELDSINEEWIHTLGRIRLIFLEENGKTCYRETKEAFLSYMSKKKREYEYEQLLCYYAFLMLPRAVDDENFWGKAQFTAVSFLMVRDLDMECFYRNMNEFLPEDRIATAKIYAKEVEHSEENLELLEEEFLFEENYQLEKLLLQVLF